MVSDLRVSIRSLVRSPGFSLAAIGVLALGIGINSAIFTLVNQVLLAPPGISNPDRVIALQAKYDKLNLRSIPISLPDFGDIHRNTQLFEKVAVVSQGDFNYTRENAAAEYLRGAPVSPEFFDVFGTKLMLGRGFLPEEDQVGANYVTVLAYSTWKRVFGGDDSIVGKSIQLNQKPYKVIGVAASDFRQPQNTDLWVPLGLLPEYYAETKRFDENYLGFARLRPGIPFLQADAYLHLLSNQFLNGGTTGGTYARNGGWGLFSVPITDFLAGNTKTPILVLFGAVAFVLLIACSNIAGLMLARTVGRGKETAIRAALGAGRWKLVLPGLSESALLTLVGGMGGAAVSYGATRLLLLTAPKKAVGNLDLRMDTHVLLFIASVTLLVGVALAIVQATQVSRISPYAVLKSSGRSATVGRGRQRLRMVLVTVETALAMILLVGAGLFLRSLERLQEVNTGFNPRGVWAASLSLSQTQYQTPEAKITFYRSSTERLLSMPGISGAAFSSLVPFSGVERTGSFLIDGRPLGPGDPEPNGNLRLVTPGYFEVMGIPVKAGRLFTSQDRSDTQPVAVIDENLAKQFWPNESALGKRIARSNLPWAEIVGVVGSVKHSDLGSEVGKGTFYFSLLQQPSPFASIIAKSHGDGMNMESQIRRAIALVDPTEAVQEIKPLPAMVADSLATRRLVTKLLGFFSLAALLTAAIGMYGVIAYSVTQRTQEIGIRMALGEQRPSVLRLILGQGVRLSGLGVLIGLAAATCGAPFLQSQWFQVTALDPVTFTLVGGIMIATALLASYVPARRALKVDPAEALHYE
jgi:predicted permease